MSWGTLGAVVVGATVLAWGLADQWLPHVRPRLERTLHSLQRSGSEALAVPAALLGPPVAAPGTSSPASAALLHKCVDAQGRTTYTDQPCTSGTRALGVQGAVTVLPP